MTDHPLNDAIERVSRAREHLGDLHARLTPFLEYGDVPAVYPQFREEMELAKAGVMPRIDLPMRIPTLIGEICYNLRSALDYLVHELTKIDTGVPQHLTQFPIEDCEKGFKRRRSKSRTAGWLQGLNERHVACIESLQPYKGCDWTATLRKISNPDKHREFTRSSGHINIFMVVAGEDAGFDRIDLPVQRATHPISGEEVEMKIHITGSISFVDGPPVIETLE